MNQQKWMLNNPKLDVVNINACAKFGQNLFIHTQDIERNKILTSFKGHNSIMNGGKWTLNNAKLDVVNINLCTKFGQNPFIPTQDIERKRNNDVIQGP